MSPANRLISACLLIAAVVSCQTAQARPNIVTGKVNCTKYSCLINGLGIVGDISDATALQFSKIIDEARRHAIHVGKNALIGHTTVSLDSPGGSVQAAMTIGRILRNERMTAQIEKGAECNSACVLIYAGAVTRYGHFNAGKLGIHQPYFEVPDGAVDPDQIRKNYGTMLTEMRAYLRENNVSEQLADEMLKTSPANIRYLNHDDQVQFGLVIFDPVETEVSTLEQAKGLGIDRAEYHRREALVIEYCYPNKGYGCIDPIMKTGRPPKPAARSNEDLSRFGTPVE